VSGTKKAREEVGEGKLTYDSKAWAPCEPSWSGSFFSPFTFDKSMQLFVKTVEREPNAMKQLLRKAEDRASSLEGS